MHKLENKLNSLQNYLKTPILKSFKAENTIGKLFNNNKNIHSNKLINVAFINLHV
jgi:hypothetical protein